MLLMLVGKNANLFYISYMKKHTHYLLLLAIIFAGSCHQQEQQQPKNGTIKAGGFQVYYEREGKGDPVLLLHAGLQDHTMWAEQVKALSQHFEVITADLPYHGNTTGSDTTIFIADIIKTLLDSLQIKKVSIAGLSMGASSALDFLLAYPGSVNKAILIAGGVTGYENKTADSISLYWYPLFKKALQDKDTALAAKEFTRAWAEGIYRKGDSLKAPVSQYIYKASLNTMRQHQVAGWPRFLEDPPAVKRLSGIKLPVLIIDGDKDLPTITANAEYMEKNIPGAKRVVMKDVAHMLNIEKPEELNKLMMDFLMQ
jgi:3-oxoadipate enol-lactonase